MDIEKVLIVGKGALGLLYGDIIARHLGPDAVRYLMDDARYERHANDEPPTINGTPCAIGNVRASEAGIADLVIVAVKATGFEAALDSMEQVVGPDTRVVSLMNGITSERRIAERFGWSGTVLAVAQGMDAAFLGRALTFAHEGEVRFGAAPLTSPDAVHDIAAFFDRAGIAYTVEDDIEHRLWVKFMLNVGVNQTCMVYGGTYGSVSDPDGEQHRSFLAAMREVQAVARAEGVELSEDDLDSMVRIITTLHPDGMPSMAQDRLNRRRSEVESFSGTVIALADKHGIHVPQNRLLYRRVQEIEAEYSCARTGGTLS